MHRIILVCTGNTCRSPMAEYILKEMAAGDQAELDIASAGLAVGTDSPINPKGAQVLQEQHAVSKSTGSFVKNHRSRQLTQSMVKEADEILTMTRDQAEYLIEIFPEAAGKVTALGDYRKTLPEPWRSRQDVVDPFGSPLSVYNETYTQLRLLLEAWYVNYSRNNKHEEDEL